MYDGSMVSAMFLLGFIIGTLFGAGWMSMKWADYLKDKGDWD